MLFAVRIWCLSSLGLWGRNHLLLQELLFSETLGGWGWGEDGRTVASQIICNLKILVTLVSAFLKKTNLAHCYHTGNKLSVILIHLSPKERKKLMSGNGIMCFSLHCGYGLFAMQISITLGRSFSFYSPDPIMWLLPVGNIYKSFCSASVFHSESNKKHSQTSCKNFLLDFKYGRTATTILLKDRSNCIVSFWRILQCTVPPCSSHKLHWNVSHSLNKPSQRKTRLGSCWYF